MPPGNEGTEGLPGRPGEGDVDGVHRAAPVRRSARVTSDPSIVPTVRLTLRIADLARTGSCALQGRLAHLDQFDVQRPIQP